MYHVRHEAIHDTDLSPEAIEAWDGKLTPEIEAALQAEGWQFVDGCMAAVKRCPCCQATANPHPGYEERTAMAAVVAEVMGDDLDGAVEALADLGPNFKYDFER